MIHFDKYHLSYRSLDCPLSSAFPLEKMINWTGIASIVLFYILILAVGMWAARKNTGGGDQEVSERLRGERKNLAVGKHKKNESNLGQEVKVWDLLAVEFQGQKSG